MNVFENFKNPTVIDKIDVYTFIDSIQNPELEILKKIEKARNIHDSDIEEYQKIKSSLPCFTLNFTYKDYKKDKNISNATGFIYIDLDNETEINLKHQFIFASWVSLSEKGRGILVKVDNLTLENFKNTYYTLTKVLNIDADMNAAKASQFNVHSYDKNLFLNNDSLTWKVKNNTFKDSPIKPLYKNLNKGNTEMGVKRKLRFSNIEDYDFNDKDYIYFEDEKEKIPQVIVPYKIYSGSRNSILSSIAYQIKAINTNIDDETLEILMLGINNKRCIPKLNKYEVLAIVNKVQKLNDIEPILNKEVRFRFNPKKKISFKDKMNIINPLLGTKRSEKTIQKLKEIIDNWDVKKYGKITQEKLKEVSGMNIKTIEKYYKLFEPQIAEIKEKYRTLKMVI